MNNKLNSLLKLLNKTKTEEEVKAAWAKCFDLEYDTADDIDLYTPQVLFEFKFDKELTQVPQLAAVKKHEVFKKLQVLDLRIDAEAQAIFQQLNNLFSPQSAFAYGDKKLITEDNFEEVFDYWNEVFGESVRNGFKSYRYFVADIQYGKTQVVADQGKVYFQDSPEDE